MVRKKRRMGLREKGKKMTLKELIKEVVNDRPAIYPMGWNTDVATIMRNAGRTFYTRKQKQIWELMIRTPYNGEAPTTSLFRSLRSAKEAMEDDIRETLASESPRFDEADFLRSGELSARIADEIFWDIEAKDLAE